MILFESTVQLFCFMCEIAIAVADVSIKVAEDIKHSFHIDQFVSHTDVEFDDLSPQVIRAYIETGEPMYVSICYFDYSGCQIFIS